MKGIIIFYGKLRMDAFKKKTTVFVILLLLIIIISILTIMIIISTRTKACTTNYSVSTNM